MGTDAKLRVAACAYAVFLTVKWIGKIDLRYKRVCFIQRICT